MKRVMFGHAPVAKSYTAFCQQQVLGANSKALPVALQAGDYVAVRIQDAGNANLFGRPLAKTSVAEFVQLHGSTTPVGSNPQPLTLSSAAAGRAPAVQAGFLTGQTPVCPSAAFAG